ncbi:MAG: tetratricopeptide repeat protein, partial [Saprospiraceae bacterium]|nr:tetratricopeptide repeat protein [Saprospiraceae bacterium]
MPQPLNRILAAIMFTDIKGYTAMMQQDEKLSISIRNRHRKIFNEITTEFGGKILQYYGDGTLSIFASAVKAVACGIKMQTEFLSDPKIPVRIGIHTGDVVYNDEEIIGDSVNLASRLESLAIPGSVLVSHKVYDEIKNQSNIKSHFLGKVLLKNVTDALPVFCIVNSPLEIPAYSDLGVKQEILKKNLAVLPFMNIGSSEEDEFFCDGITEEILNVLAKIDGMQITSRTSSFYYKNKSINIREIGETLGVDYILEGSIRRAGDKIRITAQLIQTKDDYHLWSQKFDRNLEDVFAVQDEISSIIANKLTETLQLKPSRPSKRRTVDSKAHEAYLKGRYFFNRWSPETVRQGIREYEKAITIDPLYAEAYSGQAACFIFLAMTGYDSEGMKKALGLAEKAFQLNPENAETVLALAMVRSLHQKDFTSADMYFTKALNLNPDSAAAHHYYAMHLVHTGQLDEAMIEYKRAAELDPLSLAINTDYVTALYVKGKYEEALAQVDAVLELNSSFRSAWEAKGWIYYYMQDYNNALIAFKKYQELTGSKYKGLSGMAVVLASMGNIEEAESCLDRLLFRKKENPGLLVEIDLALVYIGLEKFDLALECLDAALASGQGSI